MSSPVPGLFTRIVVSASAGDLDLVLARADRFDDHVVEAKGVHHRDDVVDRGREAAERAAPGHAAHVDARVQREFLHADAVAEDGAVGERARWVDGDDARRSCRAAVLCRQRPGQGALARARAAGDADGVRLARVRKERAQVFAAFGALVLHTADDSGERPPVAGEESLDEVVHGYFFTCS